MNPWLRQLGRSPLTEVLPHNEEGAQGSTTSKGVARRGQPSPPPDPKKKGSKADTDDARVAELRKRYKKVQDEPSGATRKSDTDQSWF